MFWGTFKVATAGILCLAGIPAAGIAIKEKFFSSKVTVPENLSEISTKLGARPMSTRSSRTSVNTVSQSRAQ